MSAIAKRAGETRVGVLLIGKVVSPLQRRLYRLSKGRISLTGHAPVLLLTTIGRRSGKPRTVPLFFLRDGDALVVCNVNPGFEGQNPWTLNLTAHNKATVELRGEKMAVEARRATSEEIDRYWPELIRLWPAYGRFYDSGGKRTIFVLTPLVRTP